VIVWKQAIRIADLANNDAMVAAMLNQTGTGWEIPLPIPPEAKKNSDTLAIHIRQNAYEKRRKNVG